MAQPGQDEFAEEFRALVDKATERAKEQQQARDQAVAERVRRAEELRNHVVMRCTELAAIPEAGIRHERRQGGPESARDLDVHQLAWTATEPHRTLQLAVDEKLDKLYWTWTEEGHETKNYEAAVVDGSRSMIDDLIRVLADQDAWWTRKVSGYHPEAQ